MKKRLLGFSLIIFLNCYLVQLSMAQSGCATTLSDAQDNFESGHLYGILALLTPCLDNGFNKTEKIQAYRLLTRAYLIIDDPISAEDSYLKLLNLDPEYKADEENDPIELVHLSRKFKTTPIFSWTIFKLGSNSTRSSVINRYSVTDNKSSFFTNAGNIGYQLSTALELNITDQWSINGEFMFAKRIFSNGNILFGEDPQSYKENQLWIELPFYIKYNRQYNKFYPYAYAGYSVQFLLRTNAEVKLINVEVEAEIPETSPNVNMTSNRNRFTQSALAGLGVRYRWKDYYFLFDLRYTMGLRNLLKKDNQYGKVDDGYNNEILFGYGYVDSDFKINSLSASLGFVYPFYKPRKIDAKPHLIQRLFKKKGGGKK